MISQGFLGNLGSIKSTPQSYVQAHPQPMPFPQLKAGETVYQTGDLRYELVPETSLQYTTNYLNYASNQCLA